MSSSVDPKCIEAKERGVDHIVLGRWESHKEFSCTKTLRRLFSQRRDTIKAIRSTSALHGDHYQDPATLISDLTGLDGEINDSTTHGHPDAVGYIESGRSLGSEQPPISAQDS